MPGGAWEFQSVLAIGALPTATPCARLHARNIACEWGLHDLADIIELVVSELVTNAVKASTDQDQRPHYADEHGLAFIHSPALDRLARIQWQRTAGPDR